MSYFFVMAAVQPRPSGATESILIIFNVQLSVMVPDNRIQTHKNDGTDLLQSAPSV